MQFLAKLEELESFEAIFGISDFEARITTWKRSTRGRGGFHHQIELLMLHGSSCNNIN